MGRVGTSPGSMCGPQATNGLRSQQEITPGGRGFRPMVTAIPLTMLVA